MCQATRLQHSYPTIAMRMAYNTVARRWPCHSCEHSLRSAPPTARPVIPVQARIYGPDFRPIRLRLHHFRLHTWLQRAMGNCHENSSQPSAIGRSRHSRLRGNPRLSPLHKPAFHQPSPFAHLCATTNGPGTIPPRGNLRITPSPLKREGWDGGKTPARQATACCGPPLDSGLRRNDTTGVHTRPHDERTRC